MASGDSSKNSKSDRDWRPRDQPPSGPSAGQSSQDPPQGPGASLRSRLGDKEPRSIPQGPSGHRNDSSSDRKGERDDRDSNRKRASSGKTFITPSQNSVVTCDIEREVGDSTGLPESANKRIRINRSRYGSTAATAPAAAFAKKALIDNEKSGRGGIGRKD